MVTAPELASLLKVLRDAGVVRADVRADAIVVEFGPAGPAGDAPTPLPGGWKAPRLDDPDLLWPREAEPTPIPES